MNDVSVSVIVLAFGTEPWLDDCIGSVLKSEGLDWLEVILVDNGCTDAAAVARISDLGGVTTLRPGKNLGFAGGCNYGAAHASGDVLAFVNSDAVVEASALRHLAAAALEPGVGIATGSIRLASTPELLNSGGNEVHFLGLGWAGCFGELASAYPERRAVTAASGAGMAITRSAWDALGGFEDHYFAYHEDAELSLRCWQQRRSVLYVPEAVVLHHYEFSRNATKLYLLERNRLIFVLTLYETRTLLMLAPVLLAFELAVLVTAAADGWAGQKLAGWAWLVRSRRWLLDRRRELHAARTVSDAELSGLFAARLRPGHIPLPRWLEPLDALLSGYWRVTRRRLRPKQG